MGQKKVTQPLGDKKKPYNLSGQKTITQPLGDKKDHKTSWDKKKSRNLSGQKKITHPFRIKKITQPLGQKNHATYRDQKITLSIGPIVRKLVHKAPNCSKWLQICPNGSK